MTDTVRCWLVERDFDSRNVITLLYATPDGERVFRKERSATAMQRGGISPTAAVDADPDNLEAVDDPETRERYAAEVERMRERHDPDEEV